MNEFYKMKCENCNWIYSSAYISQAQRLSEDHMLATGHVVQEISEVD